MNEGTLLGTLLRSANSLDILLYIRDHPGCVKSAVYRDVTRNAHTADRIGRMADMGLIDIETTSRPNTVVLSLTEKGMRFTDHLLAAESALRGSNCRFRMTDVRHLLEQINNQDLPCIGSFVASTSVPSFDP